MAWTWGEDPIEKSKTAMLEKQAQASANTAEADKQWATEEELRAKKLKSAEDYATAVEGGIADADKAAQQLGKAYQSSVKADEFNTAMGVANQVGAPIGALNQAQKQAMARRAGLEQNYASGMIQNAAQRRLAQQAAAQAQSNLADERMKMYTATVTDVQNAINALDADAQAEVDKQGQQNAVYNTQEDYNKAADNFWNKYKNNPNKKIRDAAWQKAKDIRAQKYNMGGIG